MQCRNVLGTERWELTADQFTHMCAVQLSHVMKDSNKGALPSWAREQHEQNMVMAVHLGGAALAEYTATVEEAEQAEEGAQVLGARL